MGSFFLQFLHPLVRMKRLPAYILWIVPTVLLLWTAAPLWCSELGLDLIHNRADRFSHPDQPNSVNSKIVRLRQLLFWQPDIGEDQTARVVVEQENYALQGDDDTDFILLRLRKAHRRRPPINPPGNRVAGPYGGRHSARPTGNIPPSAVES